MVCKYTYLFQKGKANFARSKKPGARSQKPEVFAPSMGNAHFEQAHLSFLIMSRPPAKNFHDLIVWKKAHSLVLSIYRFTGSFPGKEMYGLTSQLRRAAVSVPANIAEGFVKQGRSDKARFMNIAQGSLEECRYYLILSMDLGYGDNQEQMAQLEEVSRLLSKYHSSILASGS